MALYFIFFFRLFYTAIAHAQYEGLPESMFRHIGILIAFVMLMGFLHLGLLIYFIINAINNKAVDSTERIVWILVFVFAGTIGFPLYWYMRIWKAPLPA